MINLGFSRHREERWISTRCVIRKSPKSIENFWSIKRRNNGRKEKNKKRKNKRRKNKRRKNKRSKNKRRKNKRRKNKRKRGKANKSMVKIRNN